MYTYAGLCVSRLCNPTSVVCKAASLEEMYNVGCYAVRMWGYVFPAFIIQHLWLSTIASLEEMYNVGCCTNIRMWVCTTTSLEEMYSGGCCSCIRMQGYVFHAFIMQHMWAHTIASLEEMYSVGFRALV